MNIDYIFFKTGNIKAFLGFKLSNFSLISAAGELTGIQNKI